jgi:signal transduction histidine kinase
MSPHDDFENRPETAEPDHELQPADFKIERPDWTLFRSLETLGQKAGVPPSKLRRLCLKELGDNALDASPTGHVSIDEFRPGYYWICDDGPGIPGTPEEIARLFRIDRGLVSSKLWRRPQRGALGNGLRVVAGALISSGGGSLVVFTRGQRLTITPNEDGGVSWDVEPHEHPTGTIVRVSFGPLLPQDPDALLWARQAIAMAKGGAEYSGEPSVRIGSTPTPSMSLSTAPASARCVT